MLKTLTRVIELLNVYEGGPIEPGAPLHSAVVELEKYCKPPKDTGFFRCSHHHLFAPAHFCWCRLLRCSRAKNTAGALAEAKKLKELLEG